MIVAFDVDGTLIDDDDGWRDATIDLAYGFFVAGATLWVWSFGGEAYAKQWAARLLKDHTIPSALALDKYDWIASVVSAPHTTRINRSPDLHVDDTWSPKQLNGIILPYPHGMTKFSMQGHVHDYPQDPDLRVHDRGDLTT